MPSKKRKRVKAPPRKAVNQRQTSAVSDPLKLLANPADLRGLEIFLTQTRGFKLALALHDDMRVRDRVNQYLQEKLPASGVDLLLVDLRTEGADTSLLDSASAASAAYAAKPLREDGHAALVLINLENRVNYNPELASGQDPKSAYLATANLQRDLWPATFHGPVLIWVPELLEAAMAKWTPDLWHWRSHVFDLRKIAQIPLAVDPLPNRSVRSDASDETRLGAELRLPALQTQLEAYRKAGKRGDEARLLDAIGLVRLTLGQTKLAVQNFETAAAIAHKVGSKHDEGRFLGHLGSALSDLGETRRAVDFYEQAVVIAHAMGDKPSEGVGLGNLGNAWAVLGESRRAMEFYEQALTIAREMGDKRLEGIHLGHLGNAWGDLGELQKAMTNYEQALVLARHVGNKGGERSILNNLGITLAALGDSRRAISLHEQALLISREIGSKRSEGTALGNLANVWASLGELRQAIAFYEQAVSLLREVGDQRGEGLNLFNLAVNLRQLGAAAEQQRTVTLAKEALTILEVIESPDAKTVQATLAQWQAEP
jgi:tetratricopeptide (TPR) repeat protein